MKITSWSRKAGYSARLATTSLLMLISIGIILSACDSPPGSSPYETSPSPFKAMTIDPENVVFDSNEAIIDTTLTITIQATLNEGAEVYNPSFTVSRRGSSEVFREGPLEGPSGNTLTGSFSFEVPSNTFQNYTVYVFDTTPNGVLSNTFQRQLQLTGFTTLPPELLSFSHPESVQIPDEGVQPIRFETEVFHPQGQSNIQTVFLELFDSAGNRVGSGPFTMLDDGDQSPGGSGDLEEDDGIFTRTLEIGPTNQPDTYSIFTYAIDRQGLSSDTLSSTLIIE